MKEIQKMDKGGVEFLAQEEGLRLKPYFDDAGVPTIGIGNTYYPAKTSNSLLKGLPLGKKVTMKDKPLASKEVAYALYTEVGAYYEKVVWSTTRDDINQNQFNALVCIVYNIGEGNFKGSTLLKLVNKKASDAEITIAFKSWRYATVNGIKKPILLGRRVREAALYCKK